ncbi:MAG: DUF975 family protein [Clostridia bacterium]|nr:DUF975 family protein [Clostridia bacterium]
MLAPSAVVKLTAKNALKGKGLKSVAVCCVLLFVFFIAELTASLVSIFAGKFIFFVISVVFYLFAVCPLLLGVLYFFRRLIWEQDDNVLIIFKYFSNFAEYKRAVHFLFLLTIRLALAAAILFLPSFFVSILSSEKIYALLDIPLPIWTSNLWALNSFFVILSSMALVFFMIRYYLAPTIFIANDDMDPAEAVNMSTIISKRTGADFVGLVVSFTGWIVLSLFVAPLIFTLPYFITSYCVHCRFAITMYNIDVDRFNASFTPSFSTDEI